MTSHRSEPIEHHRQEIPMDDRQRTIHGHTDRVTGKPASIFTPPEDLVAAPGDVPVSAGAGDGLDAIEAPRDTATVHVSISEEATREEAEAFFDALGEWAGAWMEAHPERGKWDPFISMHTQSCDDSDHCHGPGSIDEPALVARVRELEAQVERVRALPSLWRAGTSEGVGHVIEHWRGTDYIGGRDVGFGDSADALEAALDADA